MLYDGWKAHPMFAFVTAQALVAEWLESCKEFPPRQKPSSFNLDEVIRKMSEYGKS
jgi:arylsulfatase